jgi:L-amino acid N-acyltransferase YncA
MMKGVKIERALPGNVLDVYALFKEAASQGFVYPQPTETQIKEHYFALLELLKNPYNIILLARRGRAYYGYAQASFMLRPFGQQKVIMVHTIFVTKNKRGLGIGRQMTDEIVVTAKKLGVSTIEGMCDDNNIVRFDKKYKAQKKLNFLSVEI